MKLIIDISEEDYKRVSTIVDMGLGTNVDVAIANGIPLPDCKDCILSILWCEKGEKNGSDNHS